MRDWAPGRSPALAYSGGWIGNACCHRFYILIRDVRLSISIAGCGFFVRSAQCRTSESSTKPRRRYFQFLPLFSSSSAISTLFYAGREQSVRSEKVASQRARRSPAPDAVCRQFNNYRSNGLVGPHSVHIALLGFVLSVATFGHLVVQQVQQHEIVTLIASSLDSYAVPVAKTVASAGGGDHDPLPAANGRLPKLAMEQITPPQIVLRNEHPKARR